MSESYSLDHALLAKHGINILGVVPDDTGNFLNIEYSWRDPKVPEKLRWNKTIIHMFSPNIEVDHTKHIVDTVESTRQKLEYGE